MFGARSLTSAHQPLNGEKELERARKRNGLQWVQYKIGWLPICKRFGRTRCCGPQNCLVICIAPERCLSMQTIASGHSFSKLTEVTKHCLAFSGKLCKHWVSPAIASAVGQSAVYEKSIFREFQKFQNFRTIRERKMTKYFESNRKWKKWIEEMAIRLTRWFRKFSKEFSNSLLGNNWEQEQWFSFEWFECFDSALWELLSEKLSIRKCFAEPLALRFKFWNSVASKVAARMRCLSAARWWPLRLEISGED